MFFQTVTIGDLRNKLGEYLGAIWYRSTFFVINEEPVEEVEDFCCVPYTPPRPLKGMGLSAERLLEQKIEEMQAELKALRAQRVLG